MPEEIYEIMSRETNRYANDYLTKNAATIRPNSRYKEWKDATPEEMKMFIGIIIAMGIITQLDTSQKTFCVDPCFCLYNQYKDFETEYNARKATINDD